MVEYSCYHTFEVVEARAHCHKQKSVVSIRFWCPVLTWFHASDRATRRCRSKLTQAPVNVIKGKVKYPSLLAVFSLEDEVGRFIVIGLD